MRQNTEPKIQDSAFFFTIVIVSVTCANFQLLYINQLNPMFSYSFIHLT